MNLSRGDIVLVDLEPSKGSEQGKTRPALILQNDKGNKYSPVTIVAALTSSYDQLYPTDIEIKSSEEEVDRDTKVMLNQIFTIDIETRIESKLSSLSSDKMKEVDKALKISLGLR